MDLGLKGRVALVCGASQGLGRAIVDELANEGASVAVNSRSLEKLSAICETVRERTSVDLHPVAGDLTKTSEVERVVNETIEHFGKIDVLVTNIGGPPPGTFDSLSREAWKTATQGLLTSVLDLTRLVLPGMKERKWGRILNVTSIAAKQPVENLMLSNSIRAAVTGFAKTLADEVATHGITVNNILPGYTLTERVEELADSLAKKEGIDPSEIRKRWEASIPMRRLGRTDEFAALAAFLVSERASYITGSSVAVDGGWIRSLF